MYKNQQTDLSMKSATSWGIIAHIKSDFKWGTFLACSILPEQPNRGKYLMLDLKKGFLVNPNYQAIIKLRRLYQFWQIPSSPMERILKKRSCLHVCSSPKRE